MPSLTDWVLHIAISLSTTEKLCKWERSSDMFWTDQQWQRGRQRNTQQRRLCLQFVIEIDIRFWAFSNDTRTKTSEKNLISFNNDVIAGKRKKEREISEPRIDTVFLFLSFLCVPTLFCVWVCLLYVCQCEIEIKFNYIVKHLRPHTLSFSLALLLPILPFHFFLSESNEAQYDANHFICMAYSCCCFFVRLHPVSLLSVSFVWRYCTSVCQLRADCVLFSWVSLILSHIRWVSIPNLPLTTKNSKSKRKNSAKPAPNTDDYLCATICVLASIYVDYVWKANKFACFDPSIIHF